MDDPKQDSSGEVHQNPPAYVGQTDDAYGYHDDPYAYRSEVPAAEPPVAEPPVAEHRPSPPAPPPPAPPAGGDGGDGGDEEEGMLRMSFLEHLEELRSRIIRSLIGLAVAYVTSLVFANQLWAIVSAPALIALKNLHFTPHLVITAPMETFSIVWVKLPLLTSVFLASPWIQYQVWGFIAPGLYKRERRWAAPFVISSAGLFITGGLFAYFVAFRYGLEFLLGIGRDVSIEPMVTVSEYFDLFVNVILGIGVAFELPVLIFLLTLIRVASPGFLLAHSRYAILIIVIIAAVITPTPDVFNLMLFAIPMCALFFLGVFAGWLLVLHREQRRFPWGIVLLIAAGIVLLAAGAVYVAITRYGYKIIHHWPYLTQ